MKRLATAVCVVALVLGACKKSPEKSEAKPEPAAKVSGDKAKAATPSDALAKLPLTTKSKEARALFMKARGLFQLIKRKEARPLMRKAIELDPEFARAHLWLAANLNGPARDEALGKALKFSAGLPDAERWYVEAAAAELNEDLKAANALYKKVLAAAPGSAQAHLRAGASLVNAGEREQGEKLLLKATELDPKQASIYNNLAGLYLDTERYPEALKMANKQVEILPEEPNPVDTKAEVELMMGKLAEAEASYRKVLVLDPTFHFAYEGIAVAQLYQDNAKGAIATFEAALAAAKTPEEKLSSVRGLIMTHTYSGDTKKAVAMLPELGKAADAAGFRGAVIVPLNRARIHVHLGEYKKALKQALAADAALDDKVPKGLMAFTKLVVTFAAAHSGDAAAATKAFDELKAAAPEIPFVDEAAGHVAWAKGEHDAALAAYTKAADKNSASGAPFAAIALLNSLERTGDEATALRKRATERRPRNLDVVLFRQQVLDGKK